jgi:hypothetical protein
MNHYGMFTDMGNNLIARVVLTAREFALNEEAVVRILGALAKDEQYSEATDTAVRECVLADLRSPRKL